MRPSSAATSTWRSPTPARPWSSTRRARSDVLGVFAEKRLAGAPDVPTLKEQGINAIYVQNRGLCAPAGIPADDLKVLEEAFLKYTKSETFKKYCKENMLTEA